MWNGPCRTCLVLAIAALIAGCGPSYVPSDKQFVQQPGASQRRYRVQAGAEFGYHIKIEAKWPDYTETYEGPVAYKVVSANADQIELECSGGLSARRSNVVLGMPALPIEAGPPVVGAGRKTIAIGRRGNWIDSYRIKPLPYALGGLDTLVFEEFPEQTRESWQVENDLFIQQGNLPLRHRPMSSSQRDAKERFEYTLTDSQPDSLRVAKKYSLDTGPGQVGWVGELNMTGDGQFVFDVRRGLVESSTMNYRYTTEEDGEAATAAIAVTYRLLTPEELAAQVKAREAKRQRAVERSREASEERKYPQLRGLRGTKRILAKLGLSDRLAISEVLGELAQTPTEDRPPEVARAIAQHLRSSDVKIQQYAAQALIHWGTRDVEAEVVEATQSRESLVAKYAQDALAKIRGQSLPAGPPPPTYRTWRDASGQFEIEAQFLGLEDQTVRLQRKDGEVIGVPLGKLSEGDRQFIQQQSGSDVPRVGTEAPPVAAAPPPTTPAPPAVPQDTTPVNLLTQINPQRDQVRGAWKMEGGSLVTPRDEAATLVIPGAVPPQYTLTVVAERTAGNGSLNIGLIVGGRQTMLALEGWGMMASGLNTVSGRTADDNATTFRSPVFLPGKPGTIVCTVRRSSVQVSCNGQPVMDWSGDPGQLDLDRRFWTDIPADKLFLGAWSATFRISKLELVPLGSKNSSEP